MTRSHHTSIQLCADGARPEPESFAIQVDRSSWVAGDAELIVRMRSADMDTEISIQGWVSQIVSLAVQVLDAIDIERDHPLPNRPYPDYPALSGDVMNALSAYVNAVTAYDEWLTDELLETEALRKTRDAADRLSRIDVPEKDALHAGDGVSIPQSSG